MVSYEMDASTVTMDYRVLNVKRQIWSIGSMDPGCEVHFTKDRCLDCQDMRAQVAFYSVLRADKTNCLMRQREEDFWQSCVRLPKPSELLYTRMMLIVTDGFRDITSQ